MHSYSGCFPIIENRYILDDEAYDSGNLCLLVR